MCLDLKPSNILLLSSDIDAIVMHELANRPSELHMFPKTIPPNKLPCHQLHRNLFPLLEIKNKTPGFIGLLQTLDMVCYYVNCT